MDCTKLHIAALVERIDASRSAGWNFRKGHDSLISSAWRKFSVPQLPLLATLRRSPTPVRPFLVRRRQSLEVRPKFANPIVAFKVRGT
jgi:hypothetical protein